MLEDQIPLGLTFDDVILIPQYSELLPHEVETSIQLAPGIFLNIPIVSSAMDTVTEARLAIALAREGGIGIIHRALSPEEQAHEVDKVKKSESGMITDPITIRPEQTVHEALNIMATYRISGIPVIKNRKLVGIVTNRDLRFEMDGSRKVSEVMTSRNLVTAPVGTTLEVAKELFQKHHIEKLPVVDDKNELQGLITIKDIEKKIKYPNSAKDQRGRPGSSCFPEAFGKTQEGVSVAHQNGRLVRQGAPEGRNLFFRVERGDTVFPDFGRDNLSSQEVRHQLHAVADTENGYAQSKYAGIHGRRCRIKNRCRTAGQNDRLGVPLPDFLRSFPGRMDFGIDLQFPDPPGNILRQLGSEIDNDDRIGR